MQIATPNSRKCKNVQIIHVHLVNMKIRMTQLVTPEVTFDIIKAQDGNVPVWRRVGVKSYSSCNKSN